MKSKTASKKHWEKVYALKKNNELSWYEEVPSTSLDLISSLNLNKDAAIIDIGGGNSNLTKTLLNKGFLDLSILDISSRALESTKSEIKEKADQVHWIISDILNFRPNRTYDLWHDRATFHFLTSGSDIENYISLVNQSVKLGGYLILATFSKKGPSKCSGLNISQYDSEILNKLFGTHFIQLKSFEDIHKTPSGTEQHFIYNLFQRN